MNIKFLNNNCCFTQKKIERIYNRLHTYFIIYNRTYNFIILFLTKK